MHYLIKEDWTLDIIGTEHELTSLQKLCFDI